MPTRYRFIPEGAEDAQGHAARTRCCLVADDGSDVLLTHIATGRSPVDLLVEDDVTGHGLKSRCCLAPADRDDVEGHAAKSRCCIVPADSVDPDVPQVRGWLVPIAGDDTEGHARMFSDAEVKSGVQPLTDEDADER